MSENKINGEGSANDNDDQQVRIVTIEEVYAFIKPRLEEIQKFMPSFMHVTLFARNTFEPGKDFYLSADDIVSVSESIKSIIRKRAFTTKPN